ncbi:MAG: ABC transporter substrate-binding protein, partial [Acidobacteriota bacterium]
AGSSSSLPGPRVDLADLAADLIALYPAFSELPELRDAAETVSAAVPAPRTEPSQTFDLLTRGIKRLGNGQPLVILLENLHAAEIGLDALQYLIRRVADTPTLIVGTYRSSEVYRGHGIERFLAAFADDPSFRHLELGPLDLADTQSLAEQWVGTTALPRRWIEQLHEVTEGNPLFCRELLHSLIESDAFGQVGETGLAGEIDRWSFGLDALPATLQQAEERRLERLDEETIQVLITASVLGRRFDYADLLALVGDEAHLEPLIDDLVAQGLLSEEPRRRGDRLSFSSGILRDLLYEEMSRRRRRSLHARWAEHLEQRHEGRLESVYPQLLDHYRAADRAREAVRYGLLLARWSLQHSSPEDAVRAARIALEFVEDEDVVDAHRCEAELTEVLARGHDESGFPERALRRAHRAAELYAQLDAADVDLARTAVMAAEIAWRDRRIDEVQPWVDRGLPAARNASDPTLHRRLLSLGATVANLQGGRGEALYLDELRRLDAQLQGVTDPPVAGGTMVCALALPVAVIDPSRVDTIEELEVVANLFETLLVAGEGGLIIGGLAERWWVEGSDVHFLLRQDLRFSDGSPLDAEAVIASFLRTARRRAEVLPPVYTHLVGIEAYLAGNVKTLRGLTGDGRRLTFHLREPLPIFPALLTDPRTAVARPTPSGRLVGSGPFRLIQHDDSAVRLERNPHHRDGGALIDILELRFYDDSFAIKTALQAGEIDLARDLTLDDFEALVRLPRWRSALVETVKRNVYFVLWNLQGPRAVQLELRRVMADVVRRRELVWRTLGRLAVPASSLIPPGILGHDAGRRRPILTVDEAQQRLAALDLELPARLRCVVHPMFSGRCAPLLDALVDAWRTVGVEV